MLLSTVVAALVATAPPITLSAERHRLDNGLTLILAPDRSVPGVALNLRYEVGSRDEAAGRTGFAHLFEHLMFMGSKNAPYPGFDTLMERHGGRNNATTSTDETTYFETGPSNLLELFLWLEADRLATLPEVMDAEKLEAQRKVVLNERRQSYENRPYGEADLVLFQLLYPEGHPYHHPIIGSAEDLEAATVEDVTAFFETWYRPANASLALVGDFDPAKAKALVERYFGWLPAAPKPERRSAEPVALPSTVRRTLTDEVEVPKVVLAWHSPALTAPGDAESDLLAHLLGSGKASRLYRAVVEENPLASEIYAYQYSMELAGVFAIEAVARPGVSPEALRAAIDEVLAGLLAEGPTEAELTAGLNVLFTSTARRLEGLSGKASALNVYEHLYGDPTAVQRDLARYERADRAGVLKLAKSLFESPRVEIVVLPEETAR